MKIQLSAPPSGLLNAKVKITGSKSESNRLLLLKALYADITIENCSNSDDAQVMQKGLAVSKGTVDIHHAGTAMRFLTAYFASQEGKEVLLTGSQRMTERPIKILVEALTQLGAAIEYAQEEGYPPLRIRGKKLTQHRVRLPANVSSQYISALLLIAPQLTNGLTLELEGKITSVPYIKMTLALLTQIGVTTAFEGNVISVKPLGESKPSTLVVESDWSSASYFYGIVALCELGTTIRLSAYKKDSLQGDSCLADVYRSFGISTTYENHEIILEKVSNQLPKVFEADLSNAPDIAQTLAVSCFGLGVQRHITGLHTLKIKETDRLEALKEELSKLGAQISVSNDTLTLQAASAIEKNVTIATYNDHRMAMAFAPLALKTPIFIEDAEVVSKSYPDFWLSLIHI